MAEKVQLEKGLELWKVSLDELREQDLNARVMSDAMFRRLTETIERDERLEALPFCAVTDRGIEIVSGHHRMRAARSAGMKETWALVDVSGLTQSQIKAKQLAHNAISGVDDPSMLQQIYAQLTTIEDIREAFVFEADFDKLNKASEGVGIAEVQVDFDIRTVFLMFLPTYYEKWTELLKSIPPNTDEIALADAQIAEKFREALKATGKSYDIKAATPLLCKMIDQALGDKETGDDWAYISDVFGARIPKASLEVIEKAIEKALKAKDVTKRNLWQLIEYWAADYLGG